jgi:L-alanine-DL-glutamate epimerase-like enolase superfamily enzyme
MSEEPRVAITTQTVLLVTLLTSVVGLGFWTGRQTANIDANMEASAANKAAIEAIDQEIAERRAIRDAETNRIRETISDLRTSDAVTVSAIARIDASLLDIRSTLNELAKQLNTRP